MWLAVLTSCVCVVLYVTGPIKLVKMVRKNFCSVNVLLVTSLALLVVFIAVVLIVFLGIPLIIGNQVDESVRLQKGTVQWDRFVETPVGVDFKVWLFNVTNPDDIINGEKPIIKEIGPYHYIETRKKNILSTDDKEDTVSYEQYLTMEFNQSLSGDLTEDDELTLLNPVMLSITQMTTTVERMVLGGCLENIFSADLNNLFIKIKARTMMMDGFEFAVNNYDIGVACNIVRNKVLEKASSIRNVEIVYNSKDPTQINSLKFSLFNYKVRSADGVYTVNRGQNDVLELGHIIRWNEKQTLPNWGRVESINNATCNQVRGTDSTIYAPHITRDRSLEIFSTDICRVIKIVYEKDDSYKGISAYRYGIQRDTLWSATSSPENDCFCTKRTSNPEGVPSCFLDGLMDLQSCFGGPALLSFPHFLYADEKYFDAIDGLTEPDESIHKIFLLVEPTTGTPLQGMRRVQFNFVLRPANFLTFSENLPQAVLPMMWVEEGVSLTQKYVDELNERLFDKMKVISGVKYGLLAISLAAVVTSTGFLVRKKFFTQ